MGHLKGTRWACLLLAFLSACSGAQSTARPTQQSIPQPTSTSLPPGAQRSPEIRFALVGNTTDTNVWALFDERGYSYNDYAVRSDYWPRLYRLSIPDEQFEAQAAAGMPSPVQAEGTLFAATVPIRSDLKWTDGSALTAEDAAFTVNTALRFQLGFDWRAYYDPEWLDHAAAIDAHTVKFYFKKAPNVGIWQYGALLGPIVQQAYWMPKAAEAAALLPSADDYAGIQSLHEKIQSLEGRVSELMGALATATAEQARDLQLELRRRQSDLNEAHNDLSEAQAAAEAAEQSARETLYELADSNEPLLGTWLPERHQESTWTNRANPAHPFGTPHFERAVYSMFPDEASAWAAFKRRDVNAVLEPGGISAELTGKLSQGEPLFSAPASSHYLVLNPTSTGLRDRSLRQALWCAIDRRLLAKAAGAVAMEQPALSGNQGWLAGQAPAGCLNGAGTDQAMRRLEAVNMLKAAGYLWATEPAGETAGSGLVPPGGEAIQAVMLLAPDEDADPQAAVAAKYVQQAADYLGIPVSVKSANPQDVRFAVFRSHRYDMALLGWRLSSYPGYLCDWFGQGNPFDYADEKIWSDCAQLNSTSDLNAAQQVIRSIETNLADDPAFIPLYSRPSYDVHWGVSYPVGSVPYTLSSVYGAPAFAMPSPDSP